MNFTKRTVRNALFGLVALVGLAMAQPVQAQGFTTVRWQRIGPQHVVAVPTYWQLRPNYVHAANIADVLTDRSRTEYWTVGLRTNRGVTTRTYHVNDSREAMSRARQEFPNAAVIGVKKAYYR